MLSPTNVHFTKQIRDLAVEAEQLFAELRQNLRQAHTINYESILYIEDPTEIEYSLFRRDIDFRIEHILKLHGLTRNMIYSTDFNDSFTLQPANIDVSPDMSLREFFDINFTWHCENVSIIDSIADNSTDDLFNMLGFVLSSGIESEKYVYREIERIRYFLQITKDTIASLDSVGSKIDEINDDLFDDYEQLYLNVTTD